MLFAYLRRINGGSVFEITEMVMDRQSAMMPLLPRSF